MTRRLSNIPEAVRVGHLLARARYRQLEMAAVGRFGESEVFAARARRIREMAEKMNLSVGYSALPQCPRPARRPKRCQDAFSRE